ncbi:MAG: rRNA maturation RNase YbeY, partial [Candidatus Eiseniibacteriota bacterium]
EDRQERLDVAPDVLRRIVRAVWQDRPVAVTGPSRRDAGPGSGHTSAGRRTADGAYEDGAYEEVDIVLVDDATIRRLNAAYRRLDRVTDVLSFDLRGGPGPHPGAPRTGEVVISTDRAVCQAERYAVTPGAELARLTVHGCLHLRGFDHQRPAERRVMRAAESRILTAIGDHAGALVRAGGGASPRRRRPGEGRTARR